MKNEKYKISAEEFNKVSLTRLSNSPSSPSQYNGARLGAEDLKKRMDAPLELFRDKLNALVAFLLGEGDDSAVAHISTGIKEGHTISQMLKDIISESAEFASYLSVGEKSLLKKLEGIDLSLENMGKELGNCVDKDNYERDINAVYEAIDKRVAHKDGEGENLYASEGGMDKLMPISSEALPNTAVKRDALGCVKVAEPMGDSDAVPKGYVHSHFAQKGDVPTSVANALIGSEMGEVVALKDVSPIEHNLGVKVESKNLMPYPYTDKTKTVCGITFTDNGDGTITANGTATETASYYSTANVDYPNGTYTFSGCPSGGSTSTYTINCFCRDNNNQYLVDTLEHGDGKTFTANNGFKTIGFSLRIYKGFTAENLVFKPMYERGAKKTGYKPYLANPEAVKITTMGANLFDVSKTKDNSGNDYETYDAATNTITAHSANYSAWGSLGTLTPLLPAGTYTFLKGNGYRSALCAFSVNNEEIGDFTNYNYNQKITFTVNEPFYLKAKYMLNAASYPCSASAKDFMLLSGDVSEAEYEPYKEPIEYAYGEEIKSIYPSTTLMTDTEGAVISVEYNRDINKAFEELMKIILSLGGNLYV